MKTPCFLNFVFYSYSLKYDMRDLLVMTYRNIPKNTKSKKYIFNISLEYFEKGESFKFEKFHTEIFLTHHNPKFISLVDFVTSTSTDTGV